MLMEQVKKKAWSRFVQEGALDEARLNRRIIESWAFCKKAGVDPYCGKGSILLSVEELQQKKQQNEQLLEVAAPILNKLEKSLRHTDSMLLLIDPEGFILKANGPENTLKYAKNINFTEGGRWTEELVGTNAIGTALQTNEPITVHGAEHYAIASQNWVCSAAPVRDEQGNLLGVLDVSSRLDSCAHEHTLFAVVASAYAIEHEWQKRLKDEEIYLLSLTLQQNHHKRGNNFILLNKQGVAVYIDPSLDDLQKFKNKRVKLENVEKSGFKQTMEVPVYSPDRRNPAGYQVFVVKKADDRKNWRLNCQENFKFSGVKGTSKIFRNVLVKLEKFSNTSVPVHISGETGTGKQVVARAVHDNSSRRKGPFIEVNCGAIPDNLIESELFGYAPGAFTGARKSGMKGKFLLADRGTLFLDEIGEIPETMQVALLKVLDSQRITPVGGEDELQCDVRLVTATNRNLKELVRQGRFREDLFYRLYVCPLILPSLRERGEDIPYFIDDYMKRHNWYMQWPKEILNEWIQFPWPGNVRQLLHVLDRVRILYPEALPEQKVLKEMAEETFIMEALPTQGPHKENTGEPANFRKKTEKEAIVKAIKEAGGRASVAMKKLGMPKSTFYRKLKKYNLS